MSQLSLCILVKNEAETLPHCLNSVQDLVAEIIVLDTGSSDNTVEVAKNLGAKVYHFPWRDDFSAARNESLKYATGDWILVLDADETLNPKVKDDLKQAIADEQTLVINLLRHEIGATQSPYSLVSRLFRRHPQISFSRPYHSLIDDSVTALLQQESHWQITTFPLPAIFHQGYQADKIQQLNKFSRTRKALEAYLKNHPRDPYTCNKLGALSLQEGNLKKAFKLLKTGVDTHKADPFTLYELYYHLGNAYRQNNELDKAIKNYQNALRQPILEPLKIGAYNNLGGVLQQVGSLNFAQQAYATIVDIAPDFAMGYYNLGLVLKDRHQYRDAITAYEKAIQLDPNFAWAYQNLGVVLFRGSRIPEALEKFKQAIELHRQQNHPEAQRLTEQLRQMKLL